MKKTRKVPNYGARRRKKRMAKRSFMADIRAVFLSHGLTPLKATAEARKYVRSHPAFKTTGKTRPGKRR